MKKLTEAQRAWLTAFAHGPPESMAWLDAEHRDVNGPPETWVWLAAWWSDGRTASVHTDDRTGLETLFDGATWSLTPAGRADLQAEETGK